MKAADKEDAQTIADAALTPLTLGSPTVGDEKKTHRGLMRQMHHLSPADQSEEKFSEEQNEIIGLSMSLCQKKKDGTILPRESEGTQDGEFKAGEITEIASERFLAKFCQVVLLLF